MQSNFIFLQNKRLSRNTFWVLPMKYNSNFSKHWMENPDYEKKWQKEKMTRMVQEMGGGISRITLR